MAPPGGTHAPPIRGKDQRVRVVARRFQLQPARFLATHNP